MCDDDNDVEMATACKMAFLPSVTLERIRSLIERQRLAWSDEGEDNDTDDAMLQYGRLVVTEVGRYRRCRKGECRDWCHGTCFGDDYDLVAERQ
jgi:hypothetical protein